MHSYQSDASRNGYLSFASSLHVLLTAVLGCWTETCRVSFHPYYVDGCMGTQSNRVVRR